ncbi:hypothetical protein FBU30_008490, partial [Linnemannia zychae]
FIQRLDLRHWITLGAVISNANTNWRQLRHLRVDQSKSYFQDPIFTLTFLGEGFKQQLVESVWHFALQNAATLTSLNFSQTFLRPSPLTKDLVLYDVLAKLTHLVELEIHDFKADFGKVLASAPPTLQRFRAPGRIQITSVDGDGGDGDSDGQLLRQSFSGIKEVELFKATDTRSVFSLLRYLPDLEFLLLTGGFDQEFYRSTEFHKVEGMSKMDNTPHKSLCRFHLCYTGFMDGRILSSILPWALGLREFSCEDLDMRMVNVLTEYCKNLEVVREVDTFGRKKLSSQYYPQHVNIIIPLLDYCQNLKVLDTPSHKILGDNFIECQIVCLGLEIFRCQIIGMYWLDEHHCQILNRFVGIPVDDGDDESSSTSEGELGLVEELQRNQERYRKVYLQFSRLTQLRVLDLGQEYRVDTKYPNTSFSLVDRSDAESSEDEDDDSDEEYKWYPSPIENTLELTLASGFGQLKTLTELRVFGFEGVDHRIDKIELEWMASHWPKLKVMRGIHVDVLPRVEPDPKRDELREYMQALRPDVVHETLYRHKKRKL